ncbi:MAG TPA: SIS domain-containing protein [Candidatus Tetragenococcus pullicola]|nr:SIS domain-containing protein [Candidatus Tetragenococcus pullicola]
MNIDYLQDTYQLNENERTVLTYLDNHSQSLDELTIRHVAKACFTSPASIIRLSKKLNLSGFNELVYKLKEASIASPIEREWTPSLQQTECFVDLLTENEGNLVAIIGMGFSSHLASFMGEVMNFHYLPNIQTVYTQLLNSRNNQKILFVIISHSGEEPSLKKTLELAKCQGNKVIAFVGTKQSSIAKQSYLVFSTDTFSPFLTNIAQPQLFFGQTLMVFEYLICSYINSHQNS